MKKKRRAFITGITGQDGSYLAEFLLGKGYEVYGLVRRSSSDTLKRIEHLTIPRKIQLMYGDMRDTAALSRALRRARPDEIYNLAAQSDVGISFHIPEETYEVDYYAVGRLVNAALEVNPKVKIYQASSSEMFGTTKPPQNERSPFRPVSPYAEAKLKAHQDFVEGYRKRHGLFICSGILFNHESPRRGKHFVTRKTTHSLAKIALGLQDSFSLGNLNAARDWGFAGDYVHAMWRMLQEKKPRDFVIATGESHTVRELVTTAAAALGITVRWEGKGVSEVGRDKGSGKIIIRVNPELYRPREVQALRGDARKAHRILGWKPTVTFDELVKMMVYADLDALRRDPRA